MGWQFAELLGLSNCKRLPSRNHPHPDPPPQAGEGITAAPKGRLKPRSDGLPKKSSLKPKPEKCSKSKTSTMPIPPAPCSKA